MRLAVISDIHFGPSPWYFGKNRLMAEEAKVILPKIIDEIRSTVRPDILLQLGDLIHEDMKNPSKELDSENYKKALSCISNVGVPHYHALGNHDLVTLSPADYAEILGYEKPYYSWDFQDYHCIVLYSDCAGHTNMTISSEQIEWLTRDLSQTTLSTLVFIHHPLLEQPLENHYWFQGRPDKAFIKNASEVRQILFDSGKVKLVCNGHLHENRYAVVKNIPFVTVQAVCEDFSNTGTPSACYTVIDIEENMIEVAVHGADPATYSFRPAV